MEINPNSWHAAWFRWSCRAMDKAWNSDAQREASFTWRTDLCTYFRTIALGTLAAAYSVVAWFVLVGLITWWPMWLFGMVNYLWGVLFCIMLVTTVAGVVWLTTQGFPKAVSRIKQQVQHTVMVTRDGTPTAIALVMTQVQAVKQRYCPVIKFRRMSDHD